MHRLPVVVLNLAAKSGQTSCSKEQKINYLISERNEKQNHHHHQHRHRHYHQNLETNETVGINRGRAGEGEIEKATKFERFRSVDNAPQFLYPSWSAI